MKKNKSELVIVMDRSGSMSSMKTDMEGGLKTLFEKQKKEVGECNVSLYQFDTQYEPVFERINIQDVPNIELVPRGGTALLDAIGLSINAIGEKLKNEKNEDRPETVIFSVITDGFENASKEFNKAKIKEMIKHQEEKYNWKFIFLGANQDAISEGGQYGFSAQTSMTYGSNSATGMMNVFSSGISCMRNYTTKDFAFSDSDRATSMGQ